MLFRFAAYLLRAIYIGMLSRPVYTLDLDTRCVRGHDKRYYYDNYIRQATGGSGLLQTRSVLAHPDGLRFAFPATDVNITWSLYHTTFIEANNKLITSLHLRRLE